MNDTSAKLSPATAAWIRDGAVILGVVWTFASLWQIWSWSNVVPIAVTCSPRSATPDLVWTLVATIAIIGSSAVFHLVIGTRPGRPERPGVITGTVGLIVAAVGGLALLVLFSLLSEDYNDGMIKIFVHGELVAPTIISFACLLVANTVPKTASGDLWMLTRRRHRWAFAITSLVSIVFLVGSYLAVAVGC